MCFLAIKENAMSGARTPNTSHHSENMFFISKDS